MKREIRMAALGGLGLALAAGAVIAQDRDRPREEMRMAHAGGHGGHHAGRRGEDRMRGGGRMMQQLFDTYDTDADGTLTQAEIDTARAEQLARFDTDGNGSLSLSEYEALWLDAMRARMVDRFQFHDDDGDGEVTAEEFSSRTDALVRRLDRNGDDTLSPEDARTRRRVE